MKKGESTMVISRIDKFRINCLASFEQPGLNVLRRLKTMQITLSIIFQIGKMILIKTRIGMQKQVLFFRGWPFRAGISENPPKKVRERFIFRFLTLLFFTLASLTVSAQDVGLEWAKGFLGSSTFTVGPTSIAKDAGGNVYVGGYFEGTLDFDPGPGTVNITSPAGYGISFVVKLDPVGNFLWAKSINLRAITTSPVVYSYLKVDPAGNVYITGGFAGTVDFDSGPGIYNLSSQSNWPDTYLLKLDTNGNFIFARSMGSTVNPDIVWDMEIDVAGNIYIGGYMGTGTAIYGPFTMVSVGTQDGFLVKMSPAGDYLWAKRIGGTGNDRILDLATDASGNVYFSLIITGGTTNGIANVGAGRHIIKVNGDGELVWTYQHVDWASSVSGPLNVAADSGGNVYVSRNAPAGETNLLKLNSDSTLAWEKRIGLAAGNLAVGDDDNLYITGYYSTADAVMGSFTLPSQSTYNGFVARLDGPGNILMAKAFLGSDSFGSEIFATGGDIFVAGIFQQTVDFDPNGSTYELTSPAGSGGYSGFILKLSTADLTVTLENSLSVLAVGASSDITVYIENIKAVTTLSAVSVTISKPTASSGLVLSIDPSPDWTVTQTATQFTLTLVGNIAALDTRLFTAKLTRTGGNAGTYNFTPVIANNAGGDTNNLNNRASVVFTKN